MDKKYLIINTGSASKKYAFYVGVDEAAFFHFESENGGYICNFKHKKGSEKLEITEKYFTNSIEFLLDSLIKNTFIASKKDISIIGVRVVAPGVYFEDNKIIDKEFINNMKKAGKKAPLHVDAIFKEITKLKKVFGNEFPMIGISDSAFHKEMPIKSKLYAIPLSDAKKHEIFRFGFHGISLDSIVNKLKDKNKLASKVIICHIGGGVSITAIKDGKSIDTSMGFTPLEGLVMATRVGDIDSGAVTYISRILKLKGDNLLKYLNKKCGLLGLSGGLSDDVRELIKAEGENIDAKNALDIYTYKIQKQIGAYAVALDGLDLLVFSGTVGERSFKMRERICNGLGTIGVKINVEKNNVTEGVDTNISEIDSKVSVEVVKTDEMIQIAKETINRK